MKAPQLSLMAIIAIVQSINAQQKNIDFTIAELEGMAKLWFAGYWTGLQADILLHNQINNSSDTPEWTTTNQYANDLLVDSSDVHIIGHLIDDAWENRFAIFHLSSPGLHWSSYKVAMNFYGALYRLAGFDESDVDALVRNEFMLIDSHQSLINSASFIASHVNADRLGTVVVVDSTNISEYLGYYVGLYIPTVDTVRDVNLLIGDRYVRDVYRVRLFAIHPGDSHELRLYNIEFGSGELLNSRSVVVASWP